MSLILNKAQAESVYKAAHELNYVGMSMVAKIDGLCVYVDDDGFAIVGRDSRTERYEDSFDFARAYGLK